MLLTFTNVFSQKGLNLSVSPFATTNIYNGSIDGYDAKFGFKNVMGLQLGYEKELGNGWSFLMETSFFKGDFNEADITDDFEGEYILSEFEDYLDFDFTLNFGKTINYGKRIQFPIYLGIGGGYLKGGLASLGFFQMLAKARMQFFISNRLGLFVGTTAKFGLAQDSYFFTRIGGEAGLTINF